MPNRHFTNINAYRYGFNGKEKDDEGLGGGGSTYDYGFRIYNPALGRFLSTDPLTKSYPWYTPYQFAGNKPIEAIDLDGLEEFLIREGTKGNYWYLSVRLKDGKPTGTNDYINVTIDGDPVGVIRPITPELDFYAKKVVEYYNKKTGDGGAVFKTPGPILTKVDAVEIHKKAEITVTEKAAADDTHGNEVIKDPLPPPPFISTVSGEIFKESGKKYKYGFTLGKDFNNLAKEIATYLLKNPKANMTIVIGGGYTESKDGAKDWNDPIVPGSFQGQTYSDRFNNEFKVLVNTVIELTKGKVDASRFTPEKGKIEDSLLDTKSTTQ